MLYIYCILVINARKTDGKSNRRERWGGGQIERERWGGGQIKTKKRQGEASENREEDNER